MSKKPEYSALSLCHPKQWPVWILVGLCRLLILLPYPTLMKMGRGMGKLLLRFSGKARKTAEINLNLCFPELSPKARNTLLQKNFESAGMTFFEMGLAWWGSASKLQSLCHVHGIENLHAALQKKQRRYCVQCAFYDAGNLRAINGSPRLFRRNVPPG